MSEPLRLLLAQTELGMEAEEFLKSDVGRYLLGRARQEGAHAAGDLATVFPWRKRKIQQLQNRIAWANSFESWIRELINTGRSAASTYDQIMADAQDLPVEDRLAEHTGVRNDD
jgi:hypothetical protein